ncbi:substrate-binding domain-containing protein [Microlunatus parietis]
MRDVAEAAGAPLSAVSLVLNGKSGVSHSRRQKILEAAEQLGYAPPARSTERTRTPVIGLVMEALSPKAAEDGFMASVVSGVEAGLRHFGIQMLLHLYRPDGDPLATFRSMVGRDVDGVIAANGGDIDADAIERIAAAGTPLVLVENYLETDPRIPAVVADNFTAGHQCTQHLIELGHERIGMLLGSTRYVSLTDRRRGYEIALLEHGLVPSAELMPPQTSGELVKGYAQMKQLLGLRKPPTAVYAVSDKSAFGAYQAITEAGLRVPDDISVVGTDDVQQSAATSPALTTFGVPTFELGRTAAQAMQALLTNPGSAPTRTVLLGQLAVRQSTAPPRRRSRR